eukprot:1211574-Karenia_brevis.AAC.1
MYTCKGCGTVYMYQEASEQNGMCQVSEACKGLILESDDEADVDRPKSYPSELLPKPKQLQPTAKP